MAAPYCRETETLCECAKLSRADILKAVHEGDFQSVESFYEAHDILPCGLCLDEVEAVVEEYAANPNRDEYRAFVA